MTLLTLSIALGVCVFFACKKENNDTKNDTENTGKYLYQTIFCKDSKFFTKSKGAVIMDKFSELLAKFNVQEISIFSVSENQVSLLLNHNDLFINGVDVDFNDEEYRLSLQSNILSMKSTEDDFYIYKNLETNEYFFSYNNEHYNLSLFSFEDFNLEQMDEIRFVMLVMIFNEFTDVTIDELTNPPMKIPSIVCLGAKKSNCSEEWYLEQMTKKCKGTPSYIQKDQDCGCLWGDFFCICFKSFEC